MHLFETAAFLQQNIMIHYTEEIKSQAAKILGSVDFLGNPLGLFNDVTEGLSGLLKDGNIGGLVKNVAHGVSDSTAKVTRTQGLQEKNVSPWGLGFKNKTSYMLVFPAECLTAHACVPRRVSDGPCLCSRQSV